MIESLPIRQFRDIMDAEKGVRYTRQVGGYLWVSIDPGITQARDDGIAQRYGWVMVAVDFDYQAVLFAPIEHLAELRPAPEVIGDVHAQREDP